jgi:LacI family transcriptional regulator
MEADSGQRLSARTLYDILTRTRLESTERTARALALAERHPHRTGGRRLIGVAMNLAPWQMSLTWERREHAFFDDVLFGIRSRADAGGLDVLLFTGLSCQVTGQATHYLELCRAHGAEGIVLVAFVPEEPELASIASADFPCVAVDAHLFGPRTSFVTSDNVTGAAMAVRHLAAIGRRRIAYLGGWGSEPPSVERRLGYESALAEVGLDLRREYLLRGGWLHHEARAQTSRALRLPEPPDAIFAASDVMAIGSMKAIQEAGLRIPEDVAVVGFDDSDNARLATPALTSIRQDRIGLGAAAVEATLLMLDKPDTTPPASILPVELVVRESSVGAAAGGEDDHLPPAPPSELPKLRERLTIDELYQRLGRTPAPPPRAPAELGRERRARWRPEERRLVAVASDTAVEQSVRHAFFDELFFAIRAQAAAHDVDLLIFTGVGTLPGDPYPPFLELCRRHGADGLIVSSLPMDNEALVPVVQAGFPCVAFDVDLFSPRVAFVMSDNVGGGAAATHQLARAGCSRIAFIGGRGDERPSVDRRFGYQSELARLGLPYREEYVAMASWRPDRAYEATHRFLSLPEPPDAIFAASDVMAIAAMAAIEDAGLRVPDDVAVVGFDDLDYACLLRPSLTTLRQNQEALAETLVEAMLRLLDFPEEPPLVAVLPTDLIVRESSTRPAEVGRRMDTTGEPAPGWPA